MPKRVKRTPGASSSACGANVDNPKVSVSASKTTAGDCTAPTTSVSTAPASKTTAGDRGAPTTSVSTAPASKTTASSFASHPSTSTGAASASSKTNDPDAPKATAPKTRTPKPKASASPKVHTQIAIMPDGFVYEWIGAKPEGGPSSGPVKVTAEMERIHRQNLAGALASVRNLHTISHRGITVSSAALPVRQGQARDFHVAGVAMGVGAFLTVSAATGPACKIAPRFVEYFSPLYTQIDMWESLWAFGLTHLGHVPAARAAALAARRANSQNPAKANLAAETQASAAYKAALLQVKQWAASGERASDPGWAEVQDIQNRITKLRTDIAHARDLLHDQAIKYCKPYVYLAVANLAESTEGLDAHTRRAFADMDYPKFFKRLFRTSATVEVVPLLCNGHPWSAKDSSVALAASAVLFEWATAYHRSLL